MYRLQNKIILLVAFLTLLFAENVLAQAGLKGGADGIHQYNAYTLGKWGVRAGGSGFGTFDSYAYSGNRHYHVSDNDNIGITGGTGDYKVGAFAPSLELIPYFGVGISKFLDVGAYIPYYGDLAASIGGLLGEPNGAGEAELWASGFGDLGVWTKIRTEIFPEDFLFAAAFYYELDFPTGEEGYGMRVRHPWYYNTAAGYNDDNSAKGYTDPFTAGEFVSIQMLIGTFDFKKKGYFPIRWNTYFGMALASGYGANTLIYGTGVNFIPNGKLFESQPDSLEIKFFGEFHAESRVQKTPLPRMPLDLDVMALDAGVTFNVSDVLEITLAFEMSVKAFAYLIRDYNRDSSHGYENLHESGYYGDGVTATYAISATPYYGGHLNVSIHFGGVKDPPPEPCPEPRVDTVYVTKYDTVEIAATCPVYEEKICPVPDLTHFKKSIHFKSDSYQLEERSKYILDELVDLMKMLPDVKLDLFGHTDSTASEDYNVRLSQNRARAAMKYMVENGIDSTRLQAGWSGEMQPVRDNGAEKGRRKNRRVELLPYDQTQQEKSYAEEKADGSESDQYEHPADSTQAPADTVESDFYDGAPLYLDEPPKEETAAPAEEQESPAEELAAPAEAQAPPVEEAAAPVEESESPIPAEESVPVEETNPSGKES